MTTEHLIAFNLALLVAIASPGPALLVAIQTTLSEGRRPGIAIGCGLGLMAATWTLMALLGLDLVFDVFPWAYTVAKIAGALYLIWVAWRIWSSAAEPITGQVRPRHLAFRDGILINALNPKSVLFAAAILVVIFPPDLSIGETLLIALNHLVVEVLFYSALAMAMSTRATRDRYLAAKVYLDRTAAVVLGAIGLRLLFTTRQ